MATAHTTNDLTRQQLDELDALLQKMLALPINTPEGPTSPSGAVRPTLADPPLPEPPVVANREASSASSSGAREAAPPLLYRGDPPASSNSGPQLLTLASPGEPTPAPASRKLAGTSSWSPDNGFTFEPAASKAETAPPLTLARALAQPVPVPVVTPPQPNPAPSRPAPPKTDSVSTLLVPLVAFNRGLNAALGQLGLPGRVLRSGAMKNLLACLGLFLLVYTAAKVAQTQGWIASTIALPWPT